MGIYFLLKLGKINLIFVIFPLLLIFAIVCLEYGISFLQSYVFITSSTSGHTLFSSYFSINNKF